MGTSQIEKYKEISRQCRIKCLELIFNAQTSHIGSVMSCIDILTVLFEKIDLEKDKFILSKGWVAASLYYFLWRKGVIKTSELESFCQKIECPDCRGGGKKYPCVCCSNIGCVCLKIDRDKIGGKCLHEEICKSCNGVGEVQSPFIGLTEPIIPEIPFSGGSMCMGIAAGVGFALAKKLKKEEGTIYVLESDGAMQGGLVWEAAGIASHYNLDNLVVIVDYNKFCAMGKTNEVLNVEPLSHKWGSFGWRTQDKHIDGHSYEEVEEALDWANQKSYTIKNGDGSIQEIFYKKPSVIIAHTIKGKGVSFMENNNEWHYRAPEKEEYEEAIKELK